MKRTAAGSLLRTTQAFCLQVCAKHTLNLGIVYSSDQFPDLPEVQQYREVIAQDAESLEKALGEADECFEGLERQCQVIALAEETASSAASDFFSGRGFTRQEYGAFALTSWPDFAKQKNIRVLPARPMRAALRATFDNDTLADLCEVRMNDPQYDMFVAMADGKPAGRCALYQVGDIARVMDLHTAGAQPRQDVEDALLGHVLAMARRLEMRNICTTASIDQQRAIGNLLRAGFTRDGTITEFHRIR